MEDSTFVQDSEITTYINHSIAELHDILIQTYGADYKVKNVSFNLTRNQSSYALSSIITDNDFYKMLGVDAKVNGSDWFTLNQFNFNERNKYNQSNSAITLGLNNFRYRLNGSNLIFMPVPDTDIPVQVWYIPIAQKLVNLTDTLDDLNGYDEYIVVDVAIKMLVKEESDASELMNQKVALKRRIEEAAQNRDAGSSESVTDIYATRTSWWL